MNQVSTILRNNICSSFDSLKKNVLSELDARNKQIKNLEKELERVRSEKYKDEELQKMRKSVERAEKQLQLGFPITEEEDRATTEWQKQHIQKKHGGNTYAGAIGGRFQYEFIPTTIGVIGLCRCGTCMDKVETICHRKRLTLCEKADLIKKLDVQFTFADI